MHDLELEETEVALVQEHRIEYLSKCLLKRLVAPTTANHDRAMVIWDRHLIGRIMEVGSISWSNISYALKHACLKVVII